MNAKRVSAAAGVILAAQKQRQTPAGIAAALEAAAEWAQLQDDITGACLARHEEEQEVARLRARVTELEAARTTAAADRDQQIIAWLEKKAREEGTSNKDSRVRATATYRLADKLSRGAVRPACPPVSPEDPHDSPLHHTYALGRDLPYSENPGVPTPEERGTYCPHGVLVAGPVSPNVFMVVDPWPCDRPDCTRERFERVQAEVEAELAEAETGGAL